MARTLLYLVRHGEAESDGDLTDLGRDQARRLGERLRGVPFAAMHHSPLPRAAQTAGIVAEALPGVARHACDRVADRTPVPSPPRRADYPDRYLEWLDGVPADERDEDAAALREAVAHFGTTGPHDRHELLVTHNFVIGWFVRHALDAPPWRWIGLNQDNCGLTVIGWDTGRPPALRSFNDVGHLAGLR